MLEKFTFKGFFKIEEEDTNGNRRTIFEDKNMSTTLSPTILCNLLREHFVNFHGESGVTYEYSFKEFKCSNMGSDELTSIVPNPDPDATGLIGAEEDTFTVPITQASLQTIDDSIVVVFSGYMDYEPSEDEYEQGIDFNGKVFTEFGLFMNNGECFALKNNPSYIKNSDRKLYINWGIHVAKVAI